MRDIAKETQNVSTAQEDMSNQTQTHLPANTSGCGGAGDGNTPPEVPSAGKVRVGVMGGSFDPPHIGHMLLAQDAAEALALDRVLFVPAAQAPLKPAAPRAPAALRLAMIRAAVDAHEAHAALATQSARMPRATWEVSDWEIQQGGESFSLHTARHLLALHPAFEIYWIIGADRLPSLPRWHRASELFELVHFAVAPRVTVAGDPHAVPAGARVHFLPERRFDLASTDIRARIHVGLPVDLFLPPPVLEIIHHHQLYQE